MEFDIIIRNGNLVDGSGGKIEYGDLGIIDNKIKAIGDLKDSIGDREIDATDLVVSPGFIDVHNHADYDILKIPDAENMLRQGVTTLVAGNCGESSWPIGEHLNKVETTSIRQNYAILVGYNTIKSKLPSKYSQFSSKGKHIMKKMVAEALNEGAIGVSAGLNSTIVSAPQKIAEILAPLVKSGGVFANHIRNEGEDVLNAISEIIRIGKLGVPIQISHLKAYGPPAWDKIEEILDLIDSAVQDGIEISCDRYPYNAAFRGLYAGFWDHMSEWHKKNPEISLEDVVDKPPRELKKAVRTGIEAKGGSDKIIFAPLEPMPEIEGKTLAQVADEWNISEENTALKLMNKGGVSCIYHSMLEENLQKILAHPRVMVASDGHLREKGKGVAHPRNFGTFPRVLGKYVREKGLFSLEERIKKMTMMPAKKFNLNKRGVLAKNKIADIVIFDPEQIIDHKTFQNKQQYPEGIIHVIMGGKIAIKDTNVTDNYCGKVIRRGD
ncbi:MAG: N-acyl-D-amino-acid deacylase family protein [bacterium]